MLKIGVENFANILNEYKNSDKFQRDTNEFFTECFEEYKIQNNENNTIIQADIENFFMCGNLKEFYLQQETLFPKNKQPFLVIREGLDNAISALNENKHIVILSDIGNGKSVFLRQLATKLSQEYKVYFLKHKSNDMAIYKQDIYKIAQQKHISYVIIDSYTRYLEFVRFAYLQKNIKLILSARKLDHYKQNLNKDIVPIFIDTLHDNEVELFCDIIDNIGVTKDFYKTKWRIDRKTDYIKNECYGEISHILINILESQQMTNKIKELLKISLENSNIKKHLFVVLLLNVMDIPISISLLEEMLGEYTIWTYLKMMH